MSQPVFRKSVLAFGLALAWLAVPAAAQFNTESHAFLEAVRDRDGSKVTEVINQPGNTLINTRDIATGDTALHIVVARDDTSWIKFLLQNGANPNIANKKGITPIMIAASRGNIDGVEALLGKGARIDDQDGLGETPLISATHRRDVEMVKLLLEKGADPDRTDNSGRSMRDYVAVMGDKRLAAELAAADEKRKSQTGTTYGPGI